jgi:hypothetical protein
MTKTTRTILLTTATALVLALAVPAQVDAATAFYDGNDVHAWCIADRRSHEGWACLAYTVAVAEGLSREGTLCIPGGTSGSQAEPHVRQRPTSAFYPPHTPPEHERSAPTHRRPFRQLPIVADLRARRGARRACLPVSPLSPGPLLPALALGRQAPASGPVSSHRPVPPCQPTHQPTHHPRQSRDTRDRAETRQPVKLRLRAAHLCTSICALPSSVC